VVGGGGVVGRQPPEAVPVTTNHNHAGRVCDPHCPAWVRDGIVTMKTKTVTRTVSDLIAAHEEPPLPLSVIPNHMGINLCSVDSVSWVEQDDGQLVSLTIHFIPAPTADA